jgi:uncharacterized membrane protein
MLEGGFLMSVPIAMRGKLGLLLSSIAIAILSVSNLVRDLGTNRSSLVIVHGVILVLALVVLAIAFFSKSDPSQRG